MAEHKHTEHTPSKVNNGLISIVAILGIFLIVYFSLNFSSGNVSGSAYQASAYHVSADSSGMASAIMISESNVQLCKLIVGPTTVYDSTTLATTLAADSSAFYAGFAINVEEVNVNGCVININGNSDYIAAGQVQRIGPLYVTVREIVK